MRVTRAFLRFVRCGSKEGRAHNPLNELVQLRGGKNREGPPTSGYALYLIHFHMVQTRWERPQQRIARNIPRPSKAHPADAVESSDEKK